MGRYDFRKVYANKAIKDITTQYAAVGMDVVATYNETGIDINSRVPNHKNKQIRLAVQDQQSLDYKVLNEDILKELLNNDIDRFEYTRYAKSVCELKQFNKALDSLVEQIKTTINKTINDFKVNETAIRDI